MDNFTLPDELSSQEETLSQNSNPTPKDINPDDFAAALPAFGAIGASIAATAESVGDIPPSSPTETSDSDFDFPAETPIEMDAGFEEPPVLNETSTDDLTLDDLPPQDSQQSSDEFNLPTDTPLEMDAGLEEPPVPDLDEPTFEQPSVTEPSFTEPSVDEPSVNEPTFNTPSTEETPPLDNIGDMSDFQLPSFDEPSPVPESTPTDSNDTPLDNSDYDFDFPDDTPSTPIETTDTKPTKAKKEKKMKSKPIQYADDPIDSQIGFQGLYDTETIEGKAKKKNSAPMIICIICAIISVAAVLAIIFFAPSKFSISSKESTDTQSPVISNSITDPDIEPEEELPVVEALPAEPIENAIVISETPEIVPVIPVKEAEVTPDITHIVRWGDTLWDLADTYYKNPWKYTKIAKANNLKDPDYIVSGTVLVIPSE